MATHYPLKSPRVGAMFVAGYAVVGVVAWLVLRRPQPGRPTGEWRSVIVDAAGDTSVRTLGFAWPDGGVYEWRKSGLRLHYAEFRAAVRQPNGAFCLEIPSHPRECLDMRLYVRDDSVVVTHGDTVHWVFHRAR